MGNSSTPTPPSWKKWTLPQQQQNSINSNTYKYIYIIYKPKCTWMENLVSYQAFPIQIESVRQNISSANFQSDTDLIYLQKIHINEDCDNNNDKTQITSTKWDTSTKSQQTGKKSSKWQLIHCTRAREFTYANSWISEVTHTRTIHKFDRMLQNCWALSKREKPKTTTIKTHTHKTTLWIHWKRFRTRPIVACSTNSTLWRYTQIDLKKTGEEDKYRGSSLTVPVLPKSSTHISA